MQPSTSSKSGISSEHHLPHPYSQVDGIVTVEVHRAALDVVETGGLVVTGFEVVVEIVVEDVVFGGWPLLVVQGVVVDVVFVVFVELVFDVVVSLQGEVVVDVFLVDVLVEVVFGLLVVVSLHEVVVDDVFLVEEDVVDDVFTELVVDDVTGLDDVTG